MTSVDGTEAPIGDGELVGEDRQTIQMHVEASRAVERHQGGRRGR